MPICQEGLHERQAEAATSATYQNAVLVIHLETLVRHTKSVLRHRAVPGLFRPHRRQRSVVYNLKPDRDLVFLQTASAVIANSLNCLARTFRSLKCNARNDCIAEQSVRHSMNGYLYNVVQLEDHILDFEWEDLLPTNIDNFGFAPDKAHQSAVVFLDKIASAHPAIGVHRTRRVQVPEHG